MALRGSLSDRVFNLYAPVEKSYQAEDGRSWILEGPLSNPDEDLEGDLMDSSGLMKAMATFHRLEGPVDWDHKYPKYGEPKWLIGKGIESYMAPHPRTGHVVPWLKTRLLKGKEVARQVIEHLENEGTLGYSVYGGVLQRDGKRISEPIVTMVSLTPTPVVSENAGCTRLVKSLAGFSGETGVPRPLPMVEETWDDDAALWTAHVLRKMDAVPASGNALALLESLIASPAVRKALEATPVEVPEGPGVDALRVEDLGGKTDGKRKRRVKPQEDEEEVESVEGEGGLKKALVYAVDAMLAARLSAAAGRLS